MTEMKFSLDFSKLKRDNLDPANFQKLRNYPIDSPKSNLDVNYICIFCQIPNSPRSTIPIIAKSDLTPRVETILNDNGDEEVRFVDTNKEKHVKFACVSCSAKIRSSYSLGENNRLVKEDIMTDYTPRDKADKKSESLINRHNSLTHKN